MTTAKRRGNLLLLFPPVFLYLFCFYFPFQPPARREIKVPMEEFFTFTRIVWTRSFKNAFPARNYIRCSSRRRRRRGRRRRAMYCTRTTGGIMFNKSCAFPREFFHYSKIRHVVFIRVLSYRRTNGPPVSCPLGGGGKGVRDI